MSPDPFDTAALRRAVLDAWAASPARFREDANAEEHLSIGYGGRVIAELAANAADAARAAGIAGEIVLWLSGRELRVANTGAPLTAPGVAALASLRASAKRDEGGVGHFGVGFSAVRALTDDPVIASVTGGVRFSAADTARALADLQVPALDAELRRRDGQLPALRLPWPAPPATDLPGDCVTVVRLPLRPDVDAAALAAQLTVETAVDLLWALPDLTAVTVPGHRVERTGDPDSAVTLVTTTISTEAESCARRSAMARSGAHDSGMRRRFRVQRARGILPAALLADRPVEERSRDRWRITWVLPLDESGRPDPPTRSVIGAPTPTREPTSLPARLVGTLPVDESRSRVAEGPLTDHLVAAAADAYRDLVLAAPPHHRPALIPVPGFPLGELDAALTGAVADRLRETAFLLGADGTPVTPERAALVTGLAGRPAEAVAQAMPGLLAWPDSPGEVERLRSLGVRTLPPAEVTAALAQLDRPAEFWDAVYDGLAGMPIEELADLPVPRRGGGTLVGPRGVLLPAVGAGRGSDEPGGGDGVTGDLADRAARLLPSLRLAADGVDHPLLRRLGASPADASAILGSAALHTEIRRRLEELDDADPDPADLADFADLVLDLLAAGGQADTAVLADVLLTDADGEAWPAGSLLLPGAELVELLVNDADLPIVGERWVAERGPEALARLGVRSRFAVRRYPAPPDDRTDLADVDAWWGGAGSLDEESFAAVPDMDLVADGCWPAVLQMLAADRDTRDALRPSAFGPSYTAWWLAAHATVDGLPLRGWRLPGATALTGLYDPFPVPIPADVAADLGVLATPEQAAADPAELLARWADPGREIPPTWVPAMTAALVASLADVPEADLPTGVRVLNGAVVDAEDAAVLDRPWLAQVLDPGLLVAGGADPAVVADALDLPRASERYPFRAVTDPSGTPTDLAALPEALRCLQLSGRQDLGDHPATLVPDLAVVATDRDPAEPQRVPWWIDNDRLLLDGTPEGVGRAVAYLAGHWGERHRWVAAARGGRAEQAEAGLD